MSNTSFSLPLSIMGIFGRKDPEPPKLTYEQVFADLVKNLCEKANNTLTNPLTLPAQPTLSDLEQIFKQITHDEFKNRLGYQFDTTSAAPPALAPGTSALNTFEQFYKVDDPNKPVSPPANSSTTTTGGGADPPFTPIPDDRQPLSQILDDFRSRITGLPDWVQGEAQDEAVGNLDRVFNEPTALPNEWSFDVNTPVYEQSDKYANSVRLDCIFVKLSGTLTETEVTAQLNTVYCVGIYYPVVSAAMIAKKALWKQLYTQAESLLDAPTTDPEDPDASSLEAILIWYRDHKLFQADHGFPFNGTPDGLVDDLGRPTHLFIIEDDDFSQLPQDIEKYIFSKVNLPGWAVATVKSDFQSEIESLLKSPASESRGWLPVKYDKAPPPPNEDDRALLIKGDFVYCNLVSPNRSDVTYRAAYFCGIFYSTLSTKEIAAQELLSAVYKNALRLVSDNPETPPDQPTRSDLDTLLDRALDQKFQEEFDFAYEGDKTAPGDKVGNTLYAAKVSFDSETRDDAAATEAVQTIISAFNLPPDTNEEALRQQISNDLLSRVKRCLDADPVLAPLNSWNSMSDDGEFSYSDPAKDDLIPVIKAIFLYCNASVTTGQAVAKRSFIYFAGVLYDIESQPW